MRLVVVWSLLSASLILSASCSDARRYSLTGQVIAVHPQRDELLVKHEDIRGFMPAMTMTFKVRKSAEAGERKPGDLINATLVVEDTTAYLENISKTGEAPLPPGATDLPAARMIEPGTEVPDATFTDQDGRKRPLSDWRGRTLAVTFVYTRCPLPDFCPVMDRNFAAVQKAIAADPALAARVHLLSVSFDPDYDTPEILRAHARRVGAEPAMWSYVTGTREGVDAFAAAFGVSVIRDDKPMQEIMHNLRTAVIDRNGRLVTVLNGNEWKPEALLEAIRTADGRS